LAVSGSSGSSPQAPGLVNGTGSQVQVPVPGASLFSQIIQGSGGSLGFSGAISGQGSGVGSTSQNGGSSSAGTGSGSGNGQCNAAGSGNNYLDLSARCSSKFQYVLAASTSMAVKLQEETLTYLNQGKY